MTTVHADTAVIDAYRPEVDHRMIRAAALNIIPTTTKAAEPVKLILAELAGKVNGMTRPQF